MEKLLDVIKFNYSDPSINNMLSSIGENSKNYSYHFNQNEESFIKSDRAFRVPSFDVFHDVNKTEPSDKYISTLTSVIQELIDIFPDIFRNTRYFFDPSETLRPCFIQIFKIQESFYLFILRLDLDIKLSESSIITPGTNDITAEFETENLYFEAYFIPVHKPDITTSGGTIPINRLFSSTWVGETGTGYHINGQWIDRELSKFMSSLFFPENLRPYPYFPFQCDFNTVCFSPVLLDPAGRKSQLSYFHKALPILRPALPEVESIMKTSEFNREDPAFIRLRDKIPFEWTKIWTSLKIKPYLNENEMKEYGLEFTV